MDHFGLHLAQSPAFDPSATVDDPPVAVSPMLAMPAPQPFLGKFLGVLAHGGGDRDALVEPRGITFFPNPNFTGSPVSPMGLSLSADGSPKTPPLALSFLSDSSKRPATRRDEPRFLAAVTHGHCVEIVDPQCGPVTKRTFRQRFGKKGSADSEFDEPRGIVALENGAQHGALVVADTRNHRLQVVLRRSGATVRVVGSFGTGADQFKFPHGIAELPNGNVVVTDCMNHRVQVVDPTTGLFVGRFGSEGSDPGQLRRPKGIAVLSDGMVAVADHGNNRVQVFNPETGAVVRCVGSNPHGAISPKHLLCPNGLAVLPDGRLLVCEEANHRLNILDLGADTDPFVTTIGSAGSGAHSFNFPVNAVVLPTGEVIVTDSGNHRLQVLH